VDILTQHPTTYLEALDLIVQLRGALVGALSRLILPGWELPISGETLYRIRQLAEHGAIAARDGRPAARYDVYIADLDRLKQWNTATGSQPATDAFLTPALAVRRGDAVLEGCVDNADMFIFIFPSGAGDDAIHAKLRALREAPIPAATRQAFVRALCRLRHGEIEGDRVWGRYLTGQEAVVDYPTMTIRAFHDATPGELESIFFGGDRGVFAAKNADTRGVLVEV
jgi:hypothetical protein